jgi:hypothetical protein
MNLRTRLGLALGSLGLVVGAVAMAAPAASAAVLPLPTCSTTDPGTAPNLASATNQPGLPPHCWYTAPTGGGSAGYAELNDGHTRIRFVTTNLTNNPQLVDLNGGTNQGVVGDLVCDPNNHAFGNGGWAAEVGLFGNGGAINQKNTVYYAAGFWAAGAPDPCVTHAPLVPNPVFASAGAGQRLCPSGGAGSVLSANPATLFCGSFSNPSQTTGEVGLNDVLDSLAVFYAPGGSHFHQISFGYTDVTTGIAQQAYTNSPVSLNLWESGIGAFAASQTLHAPANIPLETFSGDRVTCYSCKASVPVSAIQPVNSTGVGGLGQAQFVNASGQVVLSPLNSLTGDTFSIENGSTS